MQADNHPVLYRYISTRLASDIVDHHDAFALRLRAKPTGGFPGGLLGLK